MAPAIRPLAAADVAAVVELSLRAWAPVFDSIREVLGDDMFDQQYPTTWPVEQRQAVEAACADDAMHAFQSLRDTLRNRIAARFPIVPPQMNNHGNFIVSLGALCAWLAPQAEALGVEIYPGFAAAEPLYREALAIRGRTLPPGHPTIAATLFDLASNLKNLGRLADSEAMFRAALENARTVPDRRAVCGITL